MDLFAVFRVGIYRHECCGIFDTLEAARAAADVVQSMEPDQWHASRVYPFALNQSPRMARCNEVSEPDWLYETKPAPGLPESSGYCSYGNASEECPHLKP